MSICTIYDEEEFLKTDFHEWDEIVIAENLEIPLVKDCGVNVEPGFETRTTYPCGVRERFLHPRLYNIESFSDEYRRQAYSLAKRIKRGQKVRFLYSDNNLLLLCYIMAEIFQDCQGHHRDYLEYTNIPFPYKRSSIANAWIWACNWSNDFSQRIETEEEIEKFRNYVRLDFPQFNSEHFPVKPLKIDEEEKGVMGFSVQLGAGILEVIPGAPRGDIKVIISDFPSNRLTQARLNSRNDMRISLSIERGEMRWSGHLTLIQILRFLLIYYASKHYSGLAYGLDDNKLTRLFYSGDSAPIEMPYQNLFLTKTGEQDYNFSATLNKLLKPFLSAGISKKDILRLSESSRHLCPHDHSLKVECYHSITVLYLHGIVGYLLSNLKSGGAFGKLHPYNYITGSGLRVG